MRNWTRIIIAALIFSVVFPVSTRQIHAQQGRGEQSRMGMVHPWEDVLVPLEFDNRPFDWTLPKLPPFYAGYDPVLLYTKVKGMKDNPAKTRSSASREDQRPTVGLPIPFPSSGDIDLNAVYAFRLIPIERFYNASKQVMEVYCGLATVLSNGKPDESRKGLTVKYQPWVDNKYTSTDSRGERIEIEEHKFHEYGIAFANFSAFPVERLVLPSVRQGIEKRSKKNNGSDAAEEDLARETIVGSIRLPSKEASRLKTRMMVLALCKLIDPYITSDAVREQSTSRRFKEYFGQYYYFSARLLELWFYDFETGKIFMKMKATTAMKPK